MPYHKCFARSFRNSGSCCSAASNPGTARVFSSISLAIPLSNTSEHWLQKRSAGFKTLLHLGHLSRVTWRFSSVFSPYRSKIRSFISLSVKLAYILSICILPRDHPARCLTSCSFNPSRIHDVIALCLNECGLTRFFTPAFSAMFWIVALIVL